MQAPCKRLLLVRKLLHSAVLLTYILIKYLDFLLKKFNVNIYFLVIYKGYFLEVYNFYFNKAKTMPIFLGLLVRKLNACSVCAKFRKCDCFNCVQ